MARRKRKTPPRGKGGKFVSRKRSTRKRNPSSSRKRRASSSAPRRRRSSTAKRRRTYRRRRNPPKMKVLKKLTGGVKDAGGILLGKAAARAIPVQFGLPKQGAIGLGVQAGVGLAAAMLADKFLGREMGRMVLAGALSAPMETLVVSAGIPFLSPALSPVSQMGDLGAYAGTPLGVYAGAGRRALAGYSETLPPAPLPLSEDEEEWEPLY